MSPHRPEQKYRIDMSEYVRKQIRELENPLERRIDEQVDGLAIASRSGRSQKLRGETP